MLQRNIFSLRAVAVCRTLFQLEFVPKLQHTFSNFTSFEILEHFIHSDIYQARASSQRFQPKTSVINFSVICL